MEKKNTRDGSRLPDDWISPRHDLPPERRNGLDRDPTRPDSTGRDMISPSCSTNRLGSFGGVGGQRRLAGYDGFLRAQRDLGMMTIVHNGTN